jgi:hypothetical protein
MCRARCGVSFSIRNARDERWRDGTFRDVRSLSLRGRIPRRYSRRWNVFRSVNEKDANEACRFTSWHGLESVERRKELALLNTPSGAKQNAATARNGLSGSCVSNRSQLSVTRVAGFSDSR